MIGKLNCVKKTSWPDIAYAMHQCARFLSKPKVCHSQAVICVVCYMKGPISNGLILIPNKSKNLTTYADADWCGGWSLEEAELNKATAKSRYGYVILFMNCILLFASGLYSLVTFSTPENEYVALSESLHETILIINLIAEIKTRRIGSYKNKPNVKCTTFEDNFGALELAMVPKICPHMCHINNK